jgi:6-phosphogluconolactonase
VPPGGGPRHFAFHPAQPFTYTNNEMGMSVTVFKRDAVTGSLTPIQTIPTLPEGASHEGATTSALFVHPTGNWLYVSNRGHNSITVYRIGEDGQLTLVEHVASPMMPRGIGLSPDGRWLVACGQQDNTVVVFAIDQTTGRLRSVGLPVTMEAPVSVLFADL